MYVIDLQKLDQVTGVQAVIAAVPHTELLGIDVNKLALKGAQGMPFIDVKSAFSRDELGHAKLLVWRL